jgi:hypothetical protein
MERLDKLAEQILEDEGPESPLLMDLYEVQLDKKCFQSTANKLRSVWRQWTLRRFLPEHPSFSLVSDSTR